MIFMGFLAMAPLGARAADLVVWWDEGYYAEEREAVEEIVAAFEQETGKQVELVFHPESEHPEAIAAALQAGKPPGSSLLSPTPAACLTRLAPAAPTTTPAA
jgi:ABC-type glycerol-3-phosphate transport system substrate-binding protein